MLIVGNLEVMIIGLLVLEKHTMERKHLILETDSPFLSPIPHRGKPNDPSRIPVVASFLADWLEIHIEQLAEETNENAQRLFAFS